MVTLKWKLVFCVCAIIVVGYMVFVMVTTNRLEQQSTTEGFSPLKYRFVCLYSGENEYFSGRLEDGISDAMEEFGVWVSYYRFNASELESHCLAFEKAIESDVDGIMTNVPSAPAIGPLIDRAAGEKIPVITIVNDFYGSQRKTYIGVDYYSFGQMSAKYLCDMTDGNARTVTISSASYELSSEYRQKLLGYRDYIAHFPGMSLGSEYMVQADFLSAYSCAMSALSTRIGYNSFFCMDELTTLAVAQRLKTTGNNAIHVVGCGESDEVFSYLEQGYLDAVLMEDPYFVGSTAVSYMIRYNNGEKVPTTAYTKITEVTQENLNEIYFP